MVANADPRDDSSQAANLNGGFAQQRGEGDDAHLPAAERAQVLQDIALAPAWMRPFLREIARQEP